MELKIPIKLSLIYLTITSIIYASLLYIFETALYNYASVLALLFGLLIVYVHHDSQSKVSELKNSVLTVLNKYLFKDNISKYSLLIILTNAVVGVIGFYFISSRIDFEMANNHNNIDFRSIFLFGNSFGVLISQVGGWIFQAYLVFLFSTFLGGQGNIYHYINLVGFAYLGFLLSALVSILYNVIIFETSIIKIENLAEFFNSSYFHLISGKVGEFIVLSIICVGIMLIEKKFTFFKSFVVAIMPSLLILLFNILMQL